MHVRFPVSPLVSMLAVGCAGVSAEQTPGCIGNADTDGDGLSDCDELEVHGTAPHLADSDGDGFSDFDEIVELGFSSANNNFKFNPRIADVPKIGVDVLTAPSIDLFLESNTGEQRTVSVERSEESRDSVATTASSTQSHGIEFGVSQGISVTAGVEFGFPGFGASASTTVSFEESMATTQETSLSFSDEQRQENARALSEGEELAQSEDLTINGGVLGVAASVYNNGDIAFTLENLSLSALMTTPRGDQILSPVGALNIDVPFSEFPAETFAPRQRGEPQIFVNAGLPTGVAQSLLADATNLDVRIASYELTDANGQAFNHNQTEVSAKTATVVIDLGLDRPIERYAVATNIDADGLRVRAVDALADILRVPFALDEQGGLRSLRDLELDATIGGQWIVVHKTTDGVVETVDLSSTVTEPLDLRELQLKSGDVLHLMWYTDRDDDGLGAREEQAAGTDPDNPDTDGDGLPDGVEVNETKTLATAVDTDGDGLGDFAEVNETNTDPNVADTDGDGLRDDVELNDTLTDPNLADTDNDGLLDGVEVNETRTDPFVADTDNDGLLDGIEVNETNSSPLLADTDGDSLTDAVEVNETGTLPDVADSDGDCISDPLELSSTGTDPMVFDDGLCPFGSTTVGGPSGRTTTFSNVRLDGTQATQISADPGENVRLQLNWSMAHDGSSDFCPNCIIQLYVGIRDVFSECTMSQEVPPGQVQTGSVDRVFTAPSAPGVYYVHRRTALEFSCGVSGFSRDPGNAIAVVIVEP